MIKLLVCLFIVVFLITCVQTFVNNLVLVYRHKTSVYDLFVGDMVSDTLLKLELDIVKSDDCIRILPNGSDPKTKLGILAEKMVCAVSHINNEGTCTVCMLFYYHV